MLTREYYSLVSNKSMIFNTAVRWLGVSNVQRDNMFFSSSVIEIKTFVSSKNSANVIPKVWQMISSLSIGGIRFLRYQVEMVD